MDDKTLRSRIIRLAHANPQHRAALLPLLKRADTPDWDKLEDIYGDADASVTRCFMAMNKFIPKLKGLNLPGVDALLPRYEKARDGFRDAFGDLGDVFKAVAPNGDKLAGFSQPDPRNTLKEYAKAKKEFQEFQAWSHALQGSLRAVSKETPVADHLRILQEAGDAMAKSLAALQPVVTAYYRSQVPPRVDPRTL